MFNYHAAQKALEAYLEAEKKYFDQKETGDEDALMAEMNEAKSLIVSELSWIYNKDSRTIGAMLDVSRKEVKAAMEKEHNEMLSEYGSVLFEGEEYELTQQAHYCESAGDEYTAHAFDKNGDEYYVYWDIINPDAEEEENMCDWDNPARVSRITG